MSELKLEAYGQLNPHNIWQPEGGGQAPNDHGRLRNSRVDYIRSAARSGTPVWPIAIQRTGMRSILLPRLARKQPSLWTDEKLHNRICAGKNEKRNNLISEAKLVGEPASPVFLLAQILPEGKNTGVNENGNEKNPAKSIYNQINI
ncbi:hypothetical protein NY406_10390 [Chlorobaculum sp. MV4-Y]|uniref:hypothetical protein n=1 Tax=Chlorobaculum sp. MV4-Y TaxID=2976335 RepID=UPI0021AF0C60|nr:hypothetical protein [Chlorobaculum sp. MV4-Y]UWX57586.1 hypothetical protein NY406_10390 [Chlorobaculum sp. MV4-Y]